MTAAASSPDDPSSLPAATSAQHRALAQRAREAGDELAALAHLIAAQALDAHAAGRPAEAAAQLGMVATGYFMKGEHGHAQRWYELALALDDTQAAAWQNLAAIHAQAGREAEAERCRARAYALQRVYVESAGQPARRVLLLCAGRSAGNVPFDLLVPTPHNARIKYAIDCAPPDEDAQLPEFDLAFNAIGDPDIAGPLDERLTRFAQACARPVLNAPARVARTRRDRLPALLAGLDDVSTARCVRLEPQPEEEDGARARRLDEADLALPLLVRPAATHGGAGLVRCETPAQLDAALAAQRGACYVSAYHDTRDTHGHYRKYRMIFVDREPYPYHLAISSHWMVHYFSAEMENARWKLDEEARFLADPAAALGARGMAAVAALGRRLDLDYAGVDFTLLPDSSVFVFEANATMLVHRERAGGELAHKNVHVQRIADAFERMMARRSGVGPAGKGNGEGNGEGKGEVPARGG